MRPTPGTFGDEILLLGYTASQDNKPIELYSVAPGPLTLTLYWQALKHPTSDYTIFLHAESFDSSLILSAPDAAPLDLLDGVSLGYPTGIWELNEIVATTHTLELTSDDPLSYYVGMYEFFSFKQLERLAVFRNERRLQDDRLLLAVSLPPVELPADLRSAPAQLGDAITLLGYTASQAGQSINLNDALPGLLNLTLYWQAIEYPADDYTIFVHVQDNWGELIFGTDAPPLDGAYPTGLWSPDEIVATTHTLELLPDTGALTFFTGMYIWPSLERLPVLQDNQRAQSDRVQLITSQ